jgi:hypothetical protein
MEPVFFNRIGPHSVRLKHERLHNPKLDLVENIQKTVVRIGNFNRLTIVGSASYFILGMFKPAQKRPGLPIRGRPDIVYAAASWLRSMNASKSALIWSALVVGIPWGKPGYTFSVAPFTSFADNGADATIGTI